MSALEILTPPPVVFYNDGKARKFEVELMLQGSNHAQLSVTLLYERGDRVEDQSILEAVPGNALYLRAGRQCTLAYRINQVSSKHLNRKFRLQFTCDGAVVETNAIEVKAKPPRKQKSNGVSAPMEHNKRRKTNNMSNVVVPNINATSEPMLNALRQIESNQLHILQRINSLEQVFHRILPQMAQNMAPIADSPTQRNRPPLMQTMPGQGSAGQNQSNAPPTGQPDSMGLESLCARILEQQNSIGAGGGQQPGGARTNQIAIPSGLVSNNLVQDSGSIGGWIQDSLSALTWNFNKLPRSNLGDEPDKVVVKQQPQQQSQQQAQPQQ